MAKRKDEKMSKKKKDGFADLAAAFGGCGEPANMTA